jgi:hypothetical protein
LSGLRVKYVGTPPQEAPWRVAPRVLAAPGEVIANTCSGLPEDLEPHALGAVWRPAMADLCAHGRQVRAGETIASIKIGPEKAFVSLVALDRVAVARTSLLGADARLLIYVVDAPAPTPLVAPGVPARTERITRVLDASVHGPENGRWQLRLERAQSRLAVGEANGRLSFASAQNAAAAPDPGFQTLRFPLLGARFEPQLAATRMILPQAKTPELKLDLAAKAVLDGNEMRLPGETGDVLLEWYSWRVRNGALGSLLVFGVVALTFNWLASWRLRLAKPDAALLLGAVDVLLVLRLLMATEAMVSDVDRNWLVLPGNAVLLLASLPVAVALAWQRLQPTPMLGWLKATVWAVAAGILVWGMAQHLQPAPEGGLLFWPVLLMPLLSLGLVALLRWPQAGQLAIFSQITASKFSRWQVFWVVTSLVLLLLLRALVGERFLSLRTDILAIPVMLLLCAVLLAYGGRPGNDGSKSPGFLWGLCFWLLGYGVAAVSSYLINDSGLAFVMLWPLAATTALCWIWSQPQAMRANWLAALPLPTLASIGLLLAVLLWLYDYPIWLAGCVGAAIPLVCLGIAVWRRLPLGTFPMLMPLLLIVLVSLAPVVTTWLPPGSVSLEQAVRVDVNRARLLGELAPARLAASGTRAAMEFDSTKQVARAYAHPYSRITGKGLFDMPAPTTKLAETQLSDHAAVIHVLWPFGITGGALVTLALLVPLLLAWRCCDVAGGAGSSVMAWLGLLAALTFGLASLYILLANLEVLPFTGRDMALLAPISGADALQSWLLLLFVVQILAAPPKPQLSGAPA